MFTGTIKLNLLLNSFVFTFSAVVVPPSDCILSFLFPAETDVLVLVLFRSTDVVVVNFVLVLKFPIIKPLPEIRDKMALARAH